MNIQHELEILRKYVAEYSAARAQLSTQLAQSVGLGNELANEIEVFFEQACTNIDCFQWKVNETMKMWKIEQQKSIISGMIDNTVLGIVQHFNTDLVRLEQMIRDDLTQLLTDARVEESHLAFKGKLMVMADNLKNKIDNTLANVVVVVEQPCSSIMKHDPLTIISNAKFDIKLAILIDHRMIDIKLLREEELLVILNEGLQELFKRKPSFIIIKKADPVYTIEGTLMHISITGMLKVDINRRGHNPKALPVAEEKFKFLFCTELNFEGSRFASHAFSFPVNVLSRKDYRNSYATILWDNAFPSVDRRMFETRDAVHWSELANVLAAKFNKDIGVSLFNEHLDFIYTLIPNPTNNGLVTWEQFARTYLPQRQFTFFEWFYRVLTLVREQLLDLYRDGLIHGFISSQSAEQMLSNCVDGTFLFRFTESYCGAISIAYIHDRTFHKLFPWDLDRLRKISLPHTIKCTDFLLYLYPNYPKDEVFCKYYVANETHPSISGKGYCSDTNIAQIISNEYP